MRKIILSAVTITLIAASTSQVLAARPHHHARTAQQATSDRSRNALNAVQQPVWQYSGWSAPAGR
ncbi:hypothetical protein [Bradyrhizobium sp. CCBAU 51627]|uniref:hypothetical protein n=1 Tax=Bradyrhizobium sp. CCBAU 51627 TaxID=1325088 RepID=UPI0023051E51|nr:hypothetical protein [Bradyrhizobium sp. CCBAU 51627]MDA9437485.1 hypothetical protein [Bradyrhizobium sp. CCBAU 51627]